jgi:hypothetical protein
MSNNKMTSNQQDTLSKFKIDKAAGDALIKKQKVSFIKKILNIFINIKKSFIYIIKRCMNFKSKISIIAQTTLFLIPITIFCLLLIIYVHMHFYEDLYIFNLTKLFKEDFLDYYIVEMDDMHSELDGYVAKENYLDLENQLFYEVYYKELASIGILDSPNKQILPNISLHSETLYLFLDKDEKLIDAGDIYTIPKNKAKKYIDDRGSLGELAKIFYYMIPIMGNGAFYMNIFINQTFFIAYELNETKQIKDKELFFTIPRKKDSFIDNDNFTPTGNQLNPIIENKKSRDTNQLYDFHYNENWFVKQDYEFRESINISQDSHSEISLAHLNNEHNGNINKSLIITSQQYIKRNDKNYIINIIFFLKQNILNKKTNEYSTFIIRKNQNFSENIEKEKYSDNETYVILKSDITEYSLTNIDYQYFHYGLHDINYSFYRNGIFFDSFNLDSLHNPFKYYSTVGKFQTDLKYLTTLYLYKSLFQSINYAIISKKREEIYLYSFNDEERVKSICNAINLKEYIGYMKNSDIDCFSVENSLYYNESLFKNKSMIDIHSKYPHCSCLPLYCLEKYENIKDKDFIDDNITLASKINLPNKCQNYFMSYSKPEDSTINYTSYHYVYNYYHSFIGSRVVLPNNDYIKFQLQEINQLPGYFFFIVTQIASNADLFLYYYYNLSTKVQIIVLVSVSFFISSFVFVIVIYLSLRKYTLIIKEFKEKYELFLFQSEGNEESNENKIKKNTEEKKNHITEEIMPLLQNENVSEKNNLNLNENSLLSDLFSIFCKYYKISSHDIEKFFLIQKHETKSQMKINMMMEKNELFKLLSMFSVYAPIFKLNLSLEYKMYNYSQIIKKYDQYISQVMNIDKEQTRLTQNILYELLSTENISDYGLVTNFNFKYISNIKAEFKENSIKNAIFINIINKRRGNSISKEISINDEFLLLKDGDEHNIKLVLKKRNELIEMFRRKIQSESDEYININKLESSFNFFLINSYYKYLKQIVL